MIQPQAYWQEFECPSSAHTAYVSGGLVVLVLYATIAVRMLVTGAGLAGVSLKINFFDWGHDEHHLARDRHVLSQNINRCVYVCVCVCVCVCGVCVVCVPCQWRHHGCVCRGSPKYWPIVGVLKLVAVFVTTLTFSDDVVAALLVRRHACASRWVRRPPDGSVCGHRLW